MRRQTECQSATILVYRIKNAKDIIMQKLITTKLCIGQNKQTSLEE